MVSCIRFGCVPGIRMVRARGLIPCLARRSQSLPSGEIPSTLGNLTNLTELNIGQNNLRKRYERR